MGIIGSLIKFPFKMGKKAVTAMTPKDNTNPIESVSKLGSDFPALQDYYSTLGQDVSSYKGYAIIWKPHVSEKTKQKTLDELKNLGI